MRSAHFTARFRGSLWRLAACLALGAGLWPVSARAGVDIVGGQLSAPGDWRGVVAIKGPSGSLCTGTLIHPRVVLTAAHCTGVYSSPDEVVVYVGHDLSAPEAELGAVAVASHPDFCGMTQEDCLDFGYIVLDAELDAADVVPILSDQDAYDAYVGVGDPVLFVGYGRDDDGVSELKREVSTMVTERSTTGVAFRAGGDGKDTCNGDSGGPALIELDGGSVAVAGVLSYGSLVCGEGGVYGVPHRALCWISNDSGIDVRVEGCGDCQCIDLAAAEDDDGCGCGLESDGGRPGVAMLALVALGLWRRRRCSDQ